MHQCVTPWENLSISIQGSHASRAHLRAEPTSPLLVHPVCHKPCPHYAAFLVWSIDAKLALLMNVTTTMLYFLYLRFCHFHCIHFLFNDLHTVHYFLHAVFEMAKLNISRGELNGQDVLGENLLYL